MFAWDTVERTERILTTPEFLAIPCRGVGFLVSSSVLIDSFIPVILARCVVRPVFQMLVTEAIVVS